MSDVHITQETGDRLVVVRETQLDRETTSVLERNIRDLAAWPGDQPSQRMWALSLILQVTSLKFRHDDEAELTDTFAKAQRIVDWINT